MLPDKLTGTNQAGMKEMNTSMKTDMPAHQIERIGVRRRLKKRKVMIRNGKRRNLMVRRYALNVARKVTLRGSAIQRCLK